jgi:uncharacterized protein YlxW (UPF0749 family)
MKAVLISYNKQKNAKDNGDTSKMEEELNSVNEKLDELKSKISELFNKQ